MILLKWLELQKRLVRLAIEQPCYRVRYLPSKIRSSAEYRHRHKQPSIILASRQATHTVNNGDVVNQRKRRSVPTKLLAERFVRCCSSPMRKNVTISLANPCILPTKTSKFSHLLKQSHSNFHSHVWAILFYFS